MPYRNKEDKIAFDKAYYQKNKPHMREKNEIWKEKNKERYVDILAQWHVRNPDSWRRSAMKKYGMTLDEFKEMSAKQKDKCAICGEKEIRKRKNGIPGTTPLHIDHDHNTGIIRGLICHRCNSALGLMRDDIKILYAAIKYLESKGKD